MLFKCLEYDWFDDESCLEHDFLPSFHIPYVPFAQFVRFIVYLVHRQVKYVSKGDEHEFKTS